VVLLLQLLLGAVADEEAVLRALGLWSPYTAATDRTEHVHWSVHRQDALHVAVSGRALPHAQVEREAAQGHAPGGLLLEAVEHLDGIHLHGELDAAQRAIGF
jgi:hypothetical protein